MIYDALDATVAIDQDADVVIVGSGPAGIALANNLSKDFKTLIIEAGGLVEEQDHLSSLMGEISGIDYPLTETRARKFGGSSTLWAGYCAQFDEEDFLPISWGNPSGWPIEAYEITKYYSRALALLHVQDDCFSSHQLVSKNILPILTSSQSSNLIESKVWRFGEVKADFGLENKQVLLESPSINIILNACATKIQLRNEGQVDHLQVQTLSGRIGKIKAKVYILASGGIETPRLLLSSIDHSPLGVANKSKTVGKFFMEHPHITIEGVRVVNNKFTDWTGIEESITGQRFTRCLGLKFDVREQNHLLNAKAHFFRTPQMDYDDLPKIGLFFEQSPNPNSKVGLSQKKDALGMPLVNLNWELTSTDRHSHNITCQFIANELIRLGVAERTGKIEPSDKILHSNHHLGTTRMSTSPSNGVVDPNCKAHGIENLYIIGGSVFPSVSWANPTLTVLALVLRLADYINNQMTSVNS